MRRNVEAQNVSFCQHFVPPHPDRNKLAAEQDTAKSIAYLVDNWFITYCVCYHIMERSYHHSLLKNTTASSHFSRYCIAHSIAMPLIENQSFYLVALQLSSRYSCLLLHILNMLSLYWQSLAIALLLSWQIAFTLPYGNHESSSSSHSEGYTPYVASIEDLSAQDLNRATVNPVLMQLPPHRFTHEESLSDRAQFTPSSDDWDPIHFSIYNVYSGGYLSSQIDYTDKFVDPYEHYPARIRERHAQRIQDWYDGKYVGREEKYHKEEHNDQVFGACLDYITNYHGCFSVPLNGKVYFSPYIRPDEIGRMINDDKSGRKRLPVLHKDCDTGRWYFILHPGRRIFDY